MIVSIHQPEYLCPLSLLDKARRSDVLVLLDDVQFNRASLQHRAKIAGPKGWQWLTIPFVHAHPQLIRDVRPASEEWKTRHPRLIEETYGAMPGFGGASRFIDLLYSLPSTSEEAEEPEATVSDIASASMEYLMWAFKARPRYVVRSSRFEVEGQKGERVLRICKRIGAKCYLSGKSGAEYLDREEFKTAGIAIEVQDFTPPPGLAREVPGLSALDTWMRLGDAAPGVFHA